MEHQIKLFFLVLSVIYIFKHIFFFILKLIQENPEPLQITTVENIFIYISLAYIITSILN